MYPIVINNSLKILDLGAIEFNNPLFHTEKNIFPIGFKTIRKHASHLIPDTRWNYFCEILCSDNKPLYRVTPFTIGTPGDTLTKPLPLGME